MRGTRSRRLGGSLGGSGIGSGFGLDKFTSHGIAASALLSLDNFVGQLIMIAFVVRIDVPISTVRQSILH
jgi:hypothetical protein